MRIDFLLLVAFGLLIGSSSESRPSRCDVGKLNDPAKTSNRRFDALMTQMGRPTFWIDGCRFSFEIHPDSHRILKGMRDIAGKTSGGAAFSGFADGEFVHLKSVNRTVFLVESLRAVQVHDNKTRALPDERLDHERPPQ